jgi:1-pyrroline-5-carboxylate dehydrogenase
MSDVMFTIPEPRNEPVLGYLPGSPEKAELKAALQAMASEQVEIPLFIGGQEVRTGRLADCVMPHDHAHKLGSYHKAEEK